MEYVVKSGSPEKQRTGCLVVGVFEPRRLSPTAERIDEACGGALSALLKRGDMEGRANQVRLLHGLPNIVAERVLLVGCGRERDFHESIFRGIITAALQALADTGASDAVCCLIELPVKGHDLSWRIRQATEAAEENLYRFDNLKSKPEPSRRHLKKITWNLTGRKELAEGERAVAEALAISAGIRLAKDLANLPGNICTPRYLADQARVLVEAHPEQLALEVLGQEEMEQLGMGALLSVARGSRQPAQFLILHYRGAPAEDKPVALIGKGITFDAGGISLKPGDKMDEMKFDMSGAAAVMGTMAAAVQLALPINLVVLVPASENLPDGNASKPGDVVTSLSGQTIEILNTDAEGRLILCDALTYAERFEPSVVIDVATLTGACVVALGKHPSGLFSNHPPLTHDLQNAARYSGDRVWEMPLWEDYQDQLKSNFADMANIGGRDAGAITAACFLARFTKKFHWAHLDIAGTAWAGGDRKGATGRPVPLLVQYLLDCCQGPENN